MSVKETLKLTKQLRYLYGVNRRQAQPADVHLTGVDAGGALFQSCVLRNTGFHEYAWTVSQQGHKEVFRHDELVVLTPDSPHPLTTLSPDKVYVLGGLVDEHIIKNATLDRAAACVFAFFWVFLII